MPPDEALARILGDLEPLPEEWAALEEALGRGLVNDVVARRTQPPWDNSAMDGYAVRTADLSAVPAVLTVVDVVHAGATPGRAVGTGEAVRIMTGAPVPPGADAVVMQERTRSLGGAGLGRVEVLEAPAPRANVRDAGEDAREGEVLLRAGTALGIPELSLHCATGVSHVQVPAGRVAIVPPATSCAARTRHRLAASSTPTPGGVAGGAPRRALAQRSASPPTGPRRWRPSSPGPWTTTWSSPPPERRGRTRFRPPRAGAY